MTIRVRLLYDKQKKTKYINYVYGEFFKRQRFRRVLSGERRSTLSVYKKIQSS